jgi:hypothetical protein
MKTILAVLSLLLATATAWSGDIPATPLMTLYRFNGTPEIPYYDITSSGRSWSTAPAGFLAQGTSVVPCLVIRNGQPLTDDQGVPYVGFQVIVDARTATSTATARYTQVAGERQALRSTNHHCAPGMRYVLDVRNLYAMEKPPLFEPNRTTASSITPPQPLGELDRIVRAFHNSAACESVNQRLTGRPDALRNAWNRFIAASRQTWSDTSLQRARHLDYTMRTALFEAHLDRGCTPYGACERAVIALSIRNRALEACVGRQGCSAPGDFQGVATKVSQYNIWDGYLAQISGLTTCFLRNDLAAAQGGTHQNFKKLNGMYTQSLADVQRILFGSDQDLAAIFPGNTPTDLKKLKHYYHPPAMTKCFPQYDRIEYISGAVARKGNDFALIANTRIQVGRQTRGGYFFRHFTIREKADRDVVAISDSYPGFVIDSRRVSLKKAPNRCAPYGIPGGCKLAEIGRYRKTPSWVHSGKPLAVTCRVDNRGQQCQTAGQRQTVQVGGACDIEMRPFIGVK